MNPYSLCDIQERNHIRKRKQKKPLNICYRQILQKKFDITSPQIWHINYKDICSKILKATDGNNENYDECELMMSLVDLTLIFNSVHLPKTLETDIVPCLLNIINILEKQIMVLAYECLYYILELFPGTKINYENLSFKGLNDHERSVELTVRVLNYIFRDCGERWYSIQKRDKTSRERCESFALILQRNKFTSKVHEMIPVWKKFSFTCKKSIMRLIVSYLTYSKMHFSIQEDKNDFDLLDFAQEEIEENVLEYIPEAVQLLNYLLENQGTVDLYVYSQIFNQHMDHDMIRFIYKLFIHETRVFLKPKAIAALIDMAISENNNLEFVQMIFTILKMSIEDDSESYKVIGQEMLRVRKGVMWEEGKKVREMEKMTAEILAEDYLEHVVDLMIQIVEEGGWNIVRQGIDYLQEEYGREGVMGRMRQRMEELGCR